MTQNSDASVASAKTGERLRVLYTSTAYYPSVGGAQFHWHFIAQELQKAGMTVDVFSQWRENSSRWLLDSTVFPPQEYDYSADGISVHGRRPKWWARAAISPLLPFYYALPELAVPPISRIFRRVLDPFSQTCDLVHNVRIGREHLSWGSFKAARDRGVPFFITPNFSPRMRTTLGRLAMRHFFKLIRRADGVFVFTEREQIDLVQLGVPRENLCVIGVGPLLSTTWNTEAFKAQHQITGPLILFLGQKLPYKGFDTLLEAAPIVWKNHPDAHFAFIGPHYGRSEHRLVRSDNRIIDLPATDAFDPMKTSALKAANVVAVPSRQEGIGGVYIEAWACGTPVIACNIPFVRDIVTHGVDGFLVEQTPKDIARRITWLLDHPTEAMVMGETGRRKVEEKYVWKDIISSVLSFYHEKLGIGR